MSYITQHHLNRAARRGFVSYMAWMAVVFLFMSLVCLFCTGLGNLAG